MSEINKPNIEALVSTKDAQEVIRELGNVVWDEHLRICGRAGVDPLLTEHTPIQQKALAIAARSGSQ